MRYLDSLASPSGVGGSTGPIVQWCGFRREREREEGREGESERERERRGRAKHDANFRGFLKNTCVEVPCQLYTTW